MRTRITNTYTRIAVLLCVALACFFVSFSVSHAASLSVSPSTGVYSSGGTFTVRVAINTQGKSINAAEGELTFKPNELSVVSVSRASSIFNLWTTEPTYSNSAGTITFGGGSPSGYSGSSGNIMTITFRATGSGSSKVVFTSGSILAADGLGTNILTNMSGGTYTINALSADPEPEIVYVPEANTPGRPVVTSTTHPDPEGWYKTKTSEFSWSVPGDVTAVRTLLDSEPSSVPSKVYEPPINTISIEDLAEGVSYFHLQFRNAEGWGRIHHQRIAIDTEAPGQLTIRKPEEGELEDAGDTEGSEKQVLIFEVEDSGSGIAKYMVSIDGAEPVEFIDEDGDGIYPVPSLTPGSHTIVVEARDYAGNSTVGTFTFTVEAFERPVFTEYPERLTNQVIPVIRGTSRPHAQVTVRLEQVSAGDASYAGAIEEVVDADSEGNFRFIPEGRLALGVYELSAVAVDEDGAQSERSEIHRMIVEEPGYVRLGGFVISFLSVVVPLVALLVLLVAGTWYMWHRFSVFRTRLRKEVREAEQSLVHEFADIVNALKKNVTKLKSARKGKLTKSETDLIDELQAEIKDAESKIKKEIKDIDKLVGE